MEDEGAYARGEDLHRLTASLISDIPAEEQVTSAQRQAAKAVNFGLIFGMSGGLQQYAAPVLRLGYDAGGGLKKFRDSFFNAYAGISWWHHDLKVGTLWEGQDAYRKGNSCFPPRSGVADMANTPVQGTAADILKGLWACCLRKLWAGTGRSVGLVHDEILMEVPEREALEAAARLKTGMERAGRTYSGRCPVWRRPRRRTAWRSRARNLFAVHIYRFFIHKGC